MLDSTNHLPFESIQDKVESTTDDHVWFEQMMRCRRAYKTIWQEFIVLTNDAGSYGHMLVLLPVAETIGILLEWTSIQKGNKNVCGTWCVQSTLQIILAAIIHSQPFIVREGQYIIPQAHVVHALDSQISPPKLIFPETTSHHVPRFWIWWSCWSLARSKKQRGHQKNGCLVFFVEDPTKHLEKSIAAVSLQ